MKVAIDQVSVFHGVLHLDHKCEGHDSFKKERRRLKMKMNKSTLCGCCERNPMKNKMKIFFYIKILSFICVPYFLDYKSLGV